MKSNVNSNNIKNQELLKDIGLILFMAVLSIIFGIFTVKRIISYSYKEVSAVLVSHGEIRDVNDSKKCTGNFEYYVDGKKYETSFSVDSHYCRDGYTQTIYYDVNNPQNSIKERSILATVVLFVFDFFVFAGLFALIKDLFKPKKGKKVKKVKEEAVSDNNRIQKNKKLNHSIYGNYEITYDSEENKYGPKGMKSIQLNFEENYDFVNSEFFVSFPENLLNDLFETNKMDRVLTSYHKIDIDSIIKIFIDQEIELLSKWYEVSNSEEGKKLLNDKKIVFVLGFEIDNDLNIVSVSLSYHYADADVATFTFEYDAKNMKVKYVDVAS